MVHIVSEVARGIDHANRRGLLHRDVKPANILLAEVDEDSSFDEQRVLLTDFGVAKLSDETEALTSVGTVLATLSYASPEQLTGRRLDGRTDQYSLAATVFMVIGWGALGFGIVQVILVMVLVEVFDATGTLIGVAKRAGLLTEGPQHTDRGLSRALMADSTAILAGSMLGTSSTTAYVESASGVQAGGRSGLTALTVAVLFLLAMFFSPLAAAVPAAATAPALLFVATLMMRELVEVDWEDVTTAAPAALTALAMPFTYSIANGLAFGFISYAVLKLVTGRGREVHPATWIIAALFAIKFAFFGE